MQKCHKCHKSHRKITEKSKSHKNVTEKYDGPQWSLLFSKFLLLF